MRRKRRYERRYVDVNVLYYYLTANEAFGERAKRLLELYTPGLATSALTVWLLHVLTGLEKLDVILEEIGVEILPLTAGVLRRARLLTRPGDYEDRIHLATMMENGISTVLSNDKDFDDIPGVTRIF
ncbi:MAG: VapC toxin family PIN domain ribonuclease [Thermoprotei archaeon]|nr:MAG: VapC toxin family PIN domain ribonuclease [Thermoprotei archaeon]